MVLLFTPAFRKVEAAAAKAISRMKQIGMSPPSKLW